ncbi:response regulator transcription factor [Pseudobacillus badius]|uniref:response regulator transcription factor n=1 Tax=Bacillus badius TaxID=1455 RepID=UPI001CBAB477|nr:response regulator transcription factor [Bacillus badius]UAT30920.1 response regulator transcription factor [Bacillus badius]GLY11663.1 DNA-binding response regulator [Bacillus badius]
MRKILVVDDDKYILELVSIHLTYAGYHVMKASNGIQALGVLQTEFPDLAIVDVMMPGMDGFELTKKIRENHDIPVLLLTAKGELEDKEQGFLAGSDDYMVKPFEPKELLFRIAAILRRYDKPADSILQIGSVTINRKSFEVTAGSNTLIMPLKEFEVLALLASRPNQVFQRAAIMESVWGYDYEGDEQTLNTHIKRIRERLAKIAKDVEIVTVRGIGYKLEVRAS